MFFIAENEEISSSPPCGFLIGIYIFYENWSTETFRKKDHKSQVKHELLQIKYFQVSKIRGCRPTLSTPKS
jgi:hypothetical protein